MAAYIKGAAVLSPQKSFTEPGFPGEITTYDNVNSLKCIEPVYRDFLDPMVARRMSRLVKMGVCSALKCMKDTGIEIPDAIITGTGLGCLEDTEKFLGSIYTNDEKLLNPTPFIQSTHNTVSGAIALAIKCHGYNTTYTHRGFSFESALQDALMQIEENPEQNILTGGFDELTPGSHTITQRLGLWKNHPVNTMELLKYNTPGSLPGEGVAFFMLGGLPGHQNFAVLQSVLTFYKPAGHNDVARAVDGFLKGEGLRPSDIDLVLMGFNGDPASDSIYHYLMQDMFRSLPVAWYKHLCGEYDTSSSFALWLSSLAIKNQEVPACMILNDTKPAGIQRVLVYNHLRGNNHALYLLRQC
jgi:3-oxoacyl-[acyl-carrier-protein] synthase II